MVWQRVETMKRGRPSKYTKGEGPGRSTKRFQVALPPDLYAKLEQFRLNQEFPLERSAVIIRAVEDFLASRKGDGNESV